MQIKVGDKILFRIPYFDSFLYHRGEVINQNDKWLLVKFTAEVEMLKGYEKITHTTDIPLSFVVNDKMDHIHLF
ncbi:MAG: hypothetical protein WCI53_04795 [Bacteroidota bacterium]|jgi:hypothetical protein